jgi:hypothetical protein
MDESLVVSPTGDPLRVRAASGALLTPPPGWALLPPGDAALARRVKAAGPSWSVQERRGRKVFSRGLWAPAATIEVVRKELEVERAAPAYARRRAADTRRRAEAQAEYVEEFAGAVAAFLGFAAAYAGLARRLADAVTRHAAAVGSGTVARTKRIPVERRAEAAVIAWLRHQTTAYDHMHVPRVKGMRRQLRRQLAEVSRRLLDAHRHGAPHPAEGCALCRALAEIEAKQNEAGTA